MKNTTKKIWNRVVTHYVMSKKYITGKSNAGASSVSQQLNVKKSFRSEYGQWIEVSLGFLLITDGE